MPKFTVDLDAVAKTLDKRSIRLSEVKDKIEKVAFDVVRFRDGNPNELWQIQAGDDGSEYIVALYEPEEKIAVAAANPWSVVVKGSDLYFFYKKDYVCKVASISLGFDTSDLEMAKRYLPGKLASNPKLVTSLLKMADAPLKTKYPELA